MRGSATSLSLASHPGLVVVPKWQANRNAWGQWVRVRGQQQPVLPARPNHPLTSTTKDYMDLGVAKAPADRALRVNYDGT